MDPATSYWLRRRGAPELILFFAVCVAFYPLVTHGFVDWDDMSNFTNNEDFRGIGIAQLRWAWTTRHMGVYQPFGWMLLGLEYTWFGLDARGYHAVTVVLHAINTVLVFHLARQFVRSGDSDRVSSSELGAFLGTLLFALHPLRVEPVGWVSAQPYVASATCAIASTMAYVKSKGTTRKWLLLSFGFYVSAVLFKAAAIAVPMTWLLLDVFWFRKAHAFLSLAVAKLPFFCVAGVIASLAHLAKEESQSLAMGPTSPVHQCFQALGALGFYVEKTFVPIHLTAFYPVREGGLPASEIAMAAILVGVITTMALAVRRQLPGVLCAWGAIFIVLAPSLGFIQAGRQFAADRYTYIASVALTPLVAGGFLRWRHARWMRAAQVLSAIALALMLVLTRLQFATWEGSILLWQQIVAYAGADSAESHLNLGNAFRREGRSVEAIPVLERGLSLAPGSKAIIAAFGDALTEAGHALLQTHPQQARDYFSKAIPLRPQDPEAHLSLGVALALTKDFDSAQREFQFAATLLPQDARPHYNLGLAYRSQGRTEEAVVAFEKALELNPDFELARRELGKR